MGKKKKKTKDDLLPWFLQSLLIGGAHPCWPLGSPSSVPELSWTRPISCLCPAPRRGPAHFSPPLRLSSYAAFSVIPPPPSTYLKLQPIKTYLNLSPLQIPCSLLSLIIPHCAFCHLLIDRKLFHSVGIKKALSSSSGSSVRTRILNCFSHWYMALAQNKCSINSCHGFPRGSVVKNLPANVADKSECRVPKNSKER